MRRSTAEYPGLVVGRWRFSHRQLSSGYRGAQIVRALLGTWLGLPRAIMHVSRRSTVDQETEQFRAAVVTARVHQLLALVDQREVEIGDSHAFA
jgi:hypothetical protein